MNEGGGEGGGGGESVCLCSPTTTLDKLNNTNYNSKDCRKVQKTKSRSMIIIFLI